MRNLAKLAGTSMKKLLSILFFSGTIMMYGNALAAENVQPPDFVSAVIRMVSVLAIVLGILFVLVYVLKKINFPRKTGAGDTRCLEIVETLYLGPKKSISLIKAGSEFLVIGFMQNQMTFLSKTQLAVNSDAVHNAAGESSKS